MPWLVSADFRRAMTGAHGVEVYAEVLRPGTPPLVVPFSSDGVSGTRGQFARRSATPTLLDPTLIPAGTKDDLIGLGTEIRLWRGISWPLVAPEYAPLITGRVTGGQVAYDGTDPVGVQVDLTDRCTTLTYARFDSARPVGSQSAVALIQLFVGEVFPDIPVDVTRMAGYDVNVPAQVFTRDRDAAIKTLAAALGAEFYADPLGQFVLQPIPDPAGTPDLMIVGGEGGNRITAQKSFSDEGVYNGIQVTGQTSDAGVAPVSHTIVDRDPTSPTKWGGRFGKRIGFIDGDQSLPITTVAQADLAAAAQLRNSVGQAKSVSLTIVPDPTIQEGDLLGVTFRDGSYEQHIVDTVSIPTAADGTVTLSTRATQAITAAAS